MRISTLHTFYSNPRIAPSFGGHFFVAEIWSNGALDPWSGMGVYPESMGPTGPMVQEINEDTKVMCFHDKSS